MPETTPTAKPIQARFETALSELIHICLEAGMHPSEMVGPLKREIEWCESAAGETHRR